MSDAKSVQKHFANWEIIQFIGMNAPWPYPADGAETYIRENLLPPMEKGEKFAWVITEQNSNDEALGIIEFRKEAGTDGNRGFWLAIEHHGKGYMTEAIDSVNDFLFNKAGIERYEVCNAKGNIGSRRVKEKTGAVFLRYGNVPHHNGVAVSEHWEVTKESWLAARAKFIRG